MFLHISFIYIWHTFSPTVTLTMHTSKKLAWQQKCGVPEPHSCWADTHHLIYLNTNTQTTVSLFVPHFCFQLINAVSSLDRTVLNQLHVQLMELRGCKGHKQCNPRTRSVEPGKTNTHTLDKRHSYSCYSTAPFLLLWNSFTILPQKYEYCKL